MVFIRRIKRSVASGALFAGFLLAGGASLALLSVRPAAALSNEQLGAISQNCGTIRQSLERLEKSDSRMRTHLGAIYETVLGKFITPLNLRLVNNSLPTFSTLQTDFVIEQTTFKSAYTDYMRELEGLIATDCKAHPDEFYNKLLTVRQRRSSLQKSVEKLLKLVDTQYESVMQLKESL